MKDKKYKMFFLVVDGKDALYIKLASDTRFKVTEAREQLRDSYPKAKKITHIKNPKAISWLNLT